VKTYRPPRIPAEDPRDRDEAPEPDPDCPDDLGPAADPWPVAWGRTENDPQWAGRVREVAACKS
jgi:hypothetical protein